MNDLSSRNKTGQYAVPSAWERIVAATDKVAHSLTIISGASVTFSMLLTVADVIGRSAGHPILGAYELVGLVGALIICFSIPYSSAARTHVFMEFLINKVPRSVRNVTNTVTRIILIVLFILIGLYLFRVASGFRLGGEVTQTVHIPIYPFVYAFGMCCFLECFVFVCDIVKIWEGKYE